MAIDFYNAGMNAYAGGRYNEAYEWLIQGTEDPRCDFALGVLHYNGQGVERDYARATEHYCKAADAGIVSAQVSAGYAYANALGVPEDFNKAAYYLKKAAEADEPAAKITLAEIYAKGHAGGSRQDAARLIREVLSQGSSEEAMEIYSRYALHNT